MRGLEINRQTRRDFCAAMGMGVVAGGLLQEMAPLRGATSPVRPLLRPAGETILRRSSPESQGVSSSSVLRFMESVDQHVGSMHSVMVLRHGKVIAEAWWSPQAADKPHVLWSLSKSFTSTAVGFAVEEGKLKLHDEVLSFFPEESPKEPSSNLKAMRLVDLLTMSTGHQDEPNVKNEKNWISAFLAHPVPHKPGTHFRYNTPATFMQSAIVQKVTGMSVNKYLQDRLYTPLGITTPVWDENPQGISIGGYGLYLMTEDIAKFGLLYLQKGIWQGRQILSSDWVSMATSKQVSNGSSPVSDWDQGYGFQFWRCRHGAFRGDGKDGQFCIVMPKQDAVVVMTANTSDMQAQLNHVWNHLLPAFQDEALPENAAGLAQLTKFCDGLKATR